jgi:alpha-amylase
MIHPPQSPPIRAAAALFSGSLLFAQGTPAAVPGAFADNPIVYFLMTDRFENGDPSNDGSYGRKREATPKEDVGTFHGGDLKGVTRKLKEGWFRDLGVNALWITAPYEQIHGWIQGGKAEFKHYAYHGYYALDYTVLDKNMGTPDDLRELVATAHAQGIRILFDVVMNHPGYLDLQTARDLKVDVLWPESERATLRSYHNYIDYNSFKFGDWWGRAWVRAGLPGYVEAGRDDLTMQIAFLPDFRTESKEAVTLPTFLKNKPDTKAVDLPGTTVRGYLVKWLTDWVRQYGVDGFRCDTVKHVEPEAWAQLKQEGVKALAEWKAANPSAKIDDAPFWMVGEYWGAGPGRHKLLGSGFDAMLNFEFQNEDDAFAKPEKLFREYAKVQAGKPVHMLNYLSSHDTKLFDRDKLIQGGAALLLAPGGVQIFYGDETARPVGLEPRTDPQQGTRSDMNWAAPDTQVLAHWRKLGTFRSRHVALARGEHQQLNASPYAFSRVDAASGDRVVVALGAKGEVSIPVAGVFQEGENLRDAYTGRATTVTSGSVKVQAETYVLLERVR